MDVGDVLGMIRDLYRAAGNDRAVRNCEVERLARTVAEAEVDRLCARLPAAAPVLPRRIGA